MFDRDLGRQGYTAASVPHGVAPLPLNEQIALPRAVVSRGNGKGVEMPALDIVLDSLAVKDIRRVEVRPKPCDHLGGQRKIVATHREAGAVDRSGGSASDYGKGIAVRLNSFDLANALQNAGLIRAASTSACHH